MGNLYISEHPVILDKLTRMREKETDPAEFRRLMNDITILLGYEATSDLPLQKAEIETPICKMQGSLLDEKSVTLVPILRAAIGMVEGMLEVLPSAIVGYAGMKRNEKTHFPEAYYWNMPENIANTLVMVMDPMLATGGSAIAVIDKLKSEGCNNIRMVNIVVAPEGVAAVQNAHPDVDIYAAAIDQGLNEDAYIVPGLGDAGDRIHGTL